MKILFALMVFFLPMSSLTTTSETTTVENKTEMVNVEIEFTDGTLKTFSYSSVNEINLEQLACIDNVNICTVCYEDGRCCCTATTCEAAWECFWESCYEGPSPGVFDN